MTYSELLTELLRLKKLDPEKLQDSVVVMVNGEVTTTIQYVLWNDGSFPEIKRFQYFLSDV